MRGAIGFTLIWKGLPAQQNRAEIALSAALGYFPDIQICTIEIGETTLVIWGRDPLAQCFHTMPDGSLLVMIGTPVGIDSWMEAEKIFTGTRELTDFRLPWDGRVVLLQISADGRNWMMWNDWLGSIPVFYSHCPQWRVASTLEPIVVAVGAFGEQDIYLPGLLLLLTHGNYLSDWTLFKNMHTLCPDCVTIFDEHGCHNILCHMVQATDERWSFGWDELVDEMHALVKNAILQALQTQPMWIVPLSGGLDSRLIAAVGAEAGCNLSAYTWGPPTTCDGIYSRQIADALKVPWKRVDLGDDYLVRYLSLWIDLFGSSMHFHGMYQIPFLEVLRDAPPASIISGLIGECLAGYDVRFQSEYHRSDERLCVVHPSGYIFWDVNELSILFQVPIDQALEEIADMIEEEKNSVEGPWFQKLRFLTLWGRQNHFTYFQSMLSDYYRGVAAPYLNLEYAKFCMSLPRALLDDRHLQIEMMRRYYPKVMRIGGTYAPEPGILTCRHLLKQRAAKIIPRILADRLLPEFTAVKNLKTDVDCLHAGGKKATWPIPETSTLLGKWIIMEKVEREYMTAFGGDMRSMRKIQTIQTFAYRLMRN